MVYFDYVFVVLLFCQFVYLLRKVYFMNKKYDVPEYYSDRVRSIEYIGRRHLKVVLQDGYLFDGMQEYIIERYALYRSFSLIGKVV